MEYKLKVYSIWDCGKRVDANGEPHQEDSMFPLHNEASEQDRLFILCDGMGGHEAGEVASATVCEAMSKSILSATPNPEGNFSEDLLTDAINDAYAALDEKDSSTSERKMGTTMTLLKLYNEGCFIAHMGDSRVYHIRPGKSANDTHILFRTEDHSLVNELVKLGELTPEEAKHSRQKNIITRAMQPHAEYRQNADIHHIQDIMPGDYFYLCTDGMLENMDDNQLCYFFSDEAGDDENKVKSLLNATQENRDNHSAIIVHILDVINPIVETKTESQKQKAKNGMKLLRMRHRENIDKAPKSKTSKNKFISITLILIILITAFFLLFKTQPKSDVKTNEPPRETRSISKPIKNTNPKILLHCFDTKTIKK